MSVLQFSPFVSAIMPEFWSALTKLKIDELKLSERPIPINGTYMTARSVIDEATGQRVDSQSTPIYFDGDSFKDTPVPSTSHAARGKHAIQGSLINYNTIESFKKSKKPVLFDEASQALWRIITQSDNPTVSQLNTVLAVVYADLKKYKFYYWFAYPAFQSNPPWQLQAPWTQVDKVFSSHGAEAINAAYCKHVEGTLPEESGACLLRNTKDGGFRYSTVSQASVFFADTAATDRILLFADPCTNSESVGWPLRNILAYLYVRHSIRKLRVISWRATLSESSTSIVNLDSEINAYNLEKPVSVGWEKNEKGALAPGTADLAALMAPQRLADQAVDLNLKLMKWQILPKLDLQEIKDTRCLLLGAGTLGCYVARSLMAWGVNQITFVDSSTVSYSNPVRQPLFEFADYKKPKAACAAEALKRIHPSIEATGIQMNIPMPGHPVPPELLSSTKQAVSDLENLFNEHDVIFLLMDSRESRWLPTLLGAAKGKLVMNAALGFDTYLVMRHGVLEQPIERRLGCYYCNDIVAPMDSLSNRTLDQMCTVTRPGLAAIAGATAVELMTSVLQHPEGMHAASELTRTDGSVLGAVPHQLRGALGDFSQLKITGQAYKNCSACSEKIVNLYRKEGIDMLLKAFADATYLEEVTGLAQLQADTEAMMQEMELLSDDDDNHTTVSSGGELASNDDD